MKLSKLLCLTLIFTFTLVVYSCPQPCILLSNTTNILTVTASNSLTLNKQPTSIVSNLNRSVAIDVHVNNKLIFWSDVIERNIKRANLDGSSIITIIEDRTGVIDGLAVEWTTNLLYWTDTNFNKIEVAHLDGSRRKVLIGENLDEPRGIALDPQAGLMFWTDWGASPKIETAYLNGENRQTIISSSLGWPNDIALDYATTKIYWIDAQTDKIEHADYTGSSRGYLLLKPGIHPFGVDIYGSSLYWTDWRTVSGLHQMDKSSGTLTGKTQVNGQPMGLVVMDSSRQPPSPSSCQTNNGGCEFLCLLKPQGYVCVCPYGKVLNSDGKSCKIPASGCAKPCLYVSNTTHILSTSISLINHPIAVLSNLTLAVALDIHFNNRMIFWSDVRERKIKSANMDGSNIITVVQDRTGVIDGLAVEWTTDLLYWTDTTFNKIEVARLDGSKRKVLIGDNLDQPRGIALDPQAGVMFWTDWGTSPKIETAYTNGENRHTIISAYLGWPNDIALDYSSRKIYWIDALKDKIEYADYTGHNRANLLFHPGIHPFGIDIYSSWLYWTDWNTRSGLHQMDKTSGALINKLQVYGRRMGLVVMDSSRQPGMSSGCQTNNGGCEFLCLLKPNGYVCACPYDMVLGTDGKSCKIPASGCTQPCLYVSNTTHILSTSASLTHHPIAVLSNLTRAVALDIHINQRLIFWSDVTDKNIKRANMDGSNMITIVQNTTGVIDGLAVEWTTNMLYWTDTTFNKIEVARLDGSRRKVLIKDNLDEPRGIALDPQTGLMFWTDWGASPKIETAYLNGENRQTIISSSLGWPNDIALDYVTQTIYWVDAKTDQMERSKYDGTIRGQLYSNPGIHPFAVAIYGKWLYWTDWGTVSGLHKMNRTSGGLETKLHIYGQRMGLAINDRSRQPTVSNACQTNNGGCSHLCLLKPNGFTCHCSDGMMLDSDGKTCRIKVKCSAFTPKPNTIALTVCKTNIGSKCSFSCRSGYSLSSGSSIVTCLLSGNWSSEGPYCVDSRAPVFTSCQDNIVQYAGTDRAGLVTWSIPNATDNSGKPPNISLSQGPSTPARLTEGVYHVTYTAIDQADNKALCSFTVTIKVISCIKPTTSGVLQKRSCQNHYGGTCNFTCPHGYRMVGVSTLNCKAANGKPPGYWDKPIPKCEAIVCSALPTPPNTTKSSCHGQVNVSVGTSCQFTCLPGYKPLKPQRRTCLGNGTWTGTDLVCQPILCSGLAQPRFGSVRPSTCLNGSKYNDVCQFYCSNGFRIKGTTSRFCGRDGHWTGMNDTVCEDVTSPTFNNCPSDKVLSLGLCSSNITINWTPPVANDNSGSVRLHEPSLRPPVVLNEGIYIMNYTAVDDAGNSKTCLFKMQIIKRSCRKFSSPPNGIISSLSCNNYYGSVAVINCIPGYYISGSNTRTCKITGQWSGTSATCNRITCPSPPPFNFGTIEPKHCVTGLPVVYGTWCLFKCNISNGFQNVGPSQARCTMNGTWSEDLKNISCKDSQSPILFCPSDVTVNTDSGKPNAMYSWNVPIPKDNSGEKLKVHGSIFPPYSFNVGHTLVKYSVEDSAGLKTSCEFKVTVQDKEPPKNVFCPPKKEVQTTKRNIKVFFPEALFKDNVGVDRIVTNRINGSKMTWGEHMINYTAYDKAGNKGTCTMKLLVIGTSECQRPSPPKNGGIACDNQIVSMFCTIHCNPGYIFAIEIRSYFLCSASNGKWLSSGKNTLTVPDCSEKKPPPNINIGVQLHYLAQECNEQNANEIEKNFLQIIRSAFKQYCQLGQCNYDNIYVKCGDTDDKRRKRSLDKLRKLTIDFEVKIPYPEKNSSNVNGTLKEVQVSVLKTINESAAVVKINGETLTLTGAPKLTFMSLKCAEGEVLNGANCAGCPPGYFYESSRKACSQCPVNHYQDEEGKSSCWTCPSGTSTQKEMGSKKCVRVAHATSTNSSNVMTTIVTPVVVVVVLIVVITVFVLFLYKRYRNPRPNVSRADSDIQRVVCGSTSVQQIMENPTYDPGAPVDYIYETINVNTLHVRDEKRGLERHNDGFEEETTA